MALRLTYAEVLLGAQVLLGTVIFALGVFSFIFAMEKLDARHVDTDALYAILGALGITAGLVIMSHGIGILHF